MTQQKPRRIAVIGRDGQLALALNRGLSEAGHEVIILSRPLVDLSCPNTVRDAIIASSPEIVVNAAAYTAVDKAEDEPDLARAVNADGAGAAAAAAAEIGAPIIHFSTDYVFDGSASRPYDENDPTGPLGVYGQSKLDGERMVSAANSRHVILRTAWVCSPDGTNFVKTMLRLAAERPRLRVVDDQRGSPTFADDLAAVVLQIIPRIGAQSATEHAFGIFHVASSGETTWCQFARAIMVGAQQRGAPHVPIDGITTADYPTKARRPAYSVLSTEKLRRVHGVRLPHWEAALSGCLDQLIGPIPLKPPTSLNDI
ncbi:MAG: dTDP-4-dehydrorhamnose reductase [Hyphomicrobium sp.]|nr:dTDP-4-dehydrorhamnose reductase [Hyphomicrobium sp.]